MNRRDFLKTVLSLLPSALAAKAIGGLAAPEQESIGPPFRSSPGTPLDDLQPWDGVSWAQTASGTWTEIANSSNWYWVNDNGEWHELPFGTRATT